MFNKIIVAVMLGLLCQSQSIAEESVFWACSNLVTDYAYHRDQFNAEQFANLFTEDASLTVVNQTWNGRAEIKQRIEDLKTGSTIRHEMSTIRIVPVDADNATGVSYATIYAAPAGENTVSGFALMGEYHDEFVRTDEGWKFSKRELISKYSLER